MTPKRGWVDYAILGANAVQIAQLSSINSKMQEMMELELLDAYREQQAEAVAQLEDLLRDTVFFYAEQLRELEELAKGDPVAAYIRTKHLKYLYTYTPQFKANRFRNYEDKERLVNVQRGYDGLIRQSAQKLSPGDLEASDRCVTYIFEREKLVRLIEIQQKWKILADLKESVAKQIEPKLAALKKIKEEQQRTVRPFWKTIFEGGKSELDKQADAIELEIRSLNQDVEKRTDAGFGAGLAGTNVFNRYNPFLNKHRDVNSDAYKELLRERDNLMKRLLGEFVRSLMGDDCFDSLTIESPPTGQQNQLISDCLPSVNPDIELAQSALVEWINFGSENTNVCIFGPRLPSGSYCADSLVTAFTQLKKWEFVPAPFPMHYAHSVRYDVDSFSKHGYTFIIKDISGKIEVVGSVPIDAPTTAKVKATEYLDIELPQKVQCRETLSGKSRVLDVNYVLYGS